MRKYDLVSVVLYLLRAVAHLIVGCLLNSFMGL